MNLTITKYKARNGFRISDSDAEAIGKTIEVITATKGSATPEDIVKEASSKKSSIHHLFEWDDQKAAYRYRIDQANYYARSFEVQVIIEDGPKTRELTVRGAVSVDISQPQETDTDKTQKPEEQAYIPIVVAANDSNYLHQIISDAEQQLFSWRRQYKSYLELQKFRARLGNVIEAIEEIEVAA